MLNGYELKRVRQFNGISQSQLANYLGITNRMIIWVEKCEKEPSQGK